MSARCPRSKLWTSEDAPALCLREPFRLFFPWGVMCGCAGALLWPLFYAQWLTWHPGQAHARLMIEGLGGSFVIGFLATALPRMLEAGPFSALSVIALAGLHAAAVVSYLSTYLRVGDILFAAALALLLVLAGVRFWNRKDLPPPAFILALLGILSGLSGALALGFGLDLTGSIFAYRFPRLLIYQSFLLLPILGVGVFLLPRILKLPGRQQFPDSVTPPPGWLPSALAAGCGGLALIGTLALEAQGSIKWGNGLRFILCAGWLAWGLPGLCTSRLQGTQAWAARLGIAFILLTQLLIAALPNHLVMPIALNHGLFITGYGLLLFAISARVIDGHSGHRAEAHGKSNPLRWMVWLLILAMTTRLSADYLPKIAISHHIYAALTWVIVSLIWFIIHRRKLTTPDPEE